MKMKNNEITNNNEIRKGDNSMIEIFKNDELKLQVRTIQNEDGSISVNAEDTAIGFGWIKSERKNGKEYKIVRWDRMYGYCREFGFDHKWAKDDYIPESLFYMLGMKAKNKTAQEFQKWLAVDVIPSIRKHGAYMTEGTIEKAITNPDFLIKLATELKNEKEQRKLLEEEKKINAPKVVFADAISVSTESISVGALSKLLKQNGIEVGRTRLFEWLRENKYLMSKGSDKNMPTQRSMEQGLFEVKESVIFTRNGTPKPTFTPMVTGKGQQYFINRILKAFEK